MQIHKLRLISKIATQKNENLGATLLIELQMRLCCTTMQAKWMSIGQERFSEGEGEDFVMVRELTKTQHSQTKKNFFNSDLSVCMEEKLII